jgi:hypothetical protein
MEEDNEANDPRGGSGAEGRKQASSGRLKRALFLAILVAPLLFLVAVTGDLTLSIIQAKLVQDEALIQALDKASRERQVPAIKLHGTHGAGTFTYPEAPSRQFEIRPGDRVIYAFGASSLWQPEGDSFPEHLQQLAREQGIPLTVVNFSWFGLTSDSIMAASNPLPLKADQHHNRHHSRDKDHGLAFFRTASVPRMDPSEPTGCTSSARRATWRARPGG